MKKRLIKVIFVSASLVFAGCAYAFLFKTLGFGIPCIFKLVTGFECPGCGVSRMCMSLLSLDFKTAFRYNPAVMCMLPAGAVILFKAVYQYIKSGKFSISKSDNIVLWVMVAALIVFGIIRNII